MSEVRFGAYRIAEPIGSGALSTIYKAVHEPVGRVVAVKALKSQIAPSSSFGEQLEREAKILADLAHPNVVLLLDAGKTPAGRPFIVLEHVDGPSLQDLLAKSKKKKLPADVALAIASGICAALEHVHGRGVVHRDVKPGNVLFTRAGGIKLIDFGIAQRPRIGSVSDAEGITASGHAAPEKDAFGTPAYMSPEQVLGDFVDGRSDLFSLGVVLYEMLSGVRPFERGEDKQLRRDSAIPLRERAPGSPRAVERIVMRLLEKSPNERYASASIVKERIDAALKAETREAPSSLVVAGLADAGFVPKPKRPSLHEIREGAPIGIGRATLGLVAIAFAFGLGVLAIEGTGMSRQERRDGVLRLAPENAGGLRVLAIPWAHVRVDGELVETTPFAHPIPLSPGAHWVTLTHPDGAPIERGVEIVRGETLTLEVAMSLGAEDAGKDAR
jgi:eukaryotic-like serine/threonine-protein kinase